MIHEFTLMTIYNKVLRWCEVNEQKNYCNVIVRQKDIAVQFQDTLMVMSQIVFMKAIK